MKLNSLSHVSAALAFLLIQATYANAYTGGSGTSDDPFIVDRSDFEMDSGFYKVTQSVTFPDGKFIKIGNSTAGNHLEIDGDAIFVDAYVLMIGDNKSATGEVDVSGANCDLAMLCVGRKGTGALNVVDGGSICTHQLMVGLNDGSNGVVRVSGAGSFLSADALIDNAYYGAGYIEIDDGALVAGGCKEVENAYVAGADASIRLNGGSFAVYGNVAVGKTIEELDDLYHFQWKRSGLWAPVSIKMLRVTYIDGVVNKWADNEWYDAYHDRIDLTGFTIINAAADHFWAEAAMSSSKPGWYQSSWFGWFFNDEKSNGWTFSCEHGYIYVSDASTPGETYFWDSSANTWWFTSKWHYPYMYDYRDESWCFYHDGVYPHRNFYEYRINQAVEESDLRK